MAKFNNYESDILGLENTYDRYTVSRIIENPLNELLQIEVPTTIPNNFSVEMSVYSYANNQLVFNTTVNNINGSGVFDIITLQYTADSSIRRLLFINFSKILQPFPDGRFELVLNFFSPEIGDSITKPLVLTTISPSRTEVQLKLTPQYRTILSASQLVNFAAPEINSIHILNTLKQIFNQPNSSNLNVPTDNTSLSYGLLSEYFPETTKTFISNSVNINENYKNVISGSIQALFNKAYNYATRSIELANKDRYTDTMIINIVSSSIATAREQVQFSEIILV